MIRRSAAPALAVCCLVYAWCFVLDTGAHRKLVAWRVRRLVHQARNSLNRTSSADQLMTMARSSWEYESVIAIAGVGKIGSAAKPHIRDLAVLLDSPKPAVSQEAARALEKLAPHSKKALPQLVTRIQKQPPDATTWIAIEAVGALGAEATEAIPLLERMKGCEPAMFRGCVADAIERIRRKETQ